MQKKCAKPSQGGGGEGVSPEGYLLFPHVTLSQSSHPQLEKIPTIQYVGIFCEYSVYFTAKKWPSVTIGVVSKSTQDKPMAEKKRQGARP